MLKKMAHSLFAFILILARAGVVCHADPAQDLLNAIEKKDLNAARAALDAGANANAVTNSVVGPTITPLGYAIDHNATEIVKLLLDRGADVNFSPPHVDPPLWDAVQLGNAEIVAMLLNRGANPDFRDDMTNFTLLILAAYKQRTEIAGLLLAHGAPVDEASPDGVTPLEMAAGTEDTPLVKMLLDRHADINHSDDSGRTVLMNAAACKTCTSASVKLLLARGAELEAKDKKGQTAFYYAQVQNNQEILKVLVDAGANGGKMPAPAATELSVTDKAFLLDQCKVEQQDIDVIPKLDDKVKQRMLSQIAMRDCDLLTDFVNSRNYFRKLKPGAEIPFPPAGWSGDYLTDDKFQQYKNILNSAPL